MINIDDLLAKDIIPDCADPGRNPIKTKRNPKALSKNLDCEDRQAALMRHVAELQEESTSDRHRRGERTTLRATDQFFPESFGPPYEV